MHPNIPPSTPSAPQACHNLRLSPPHPCLLGEVSPLCHAAYHLPSLHHTTLRLGAARCPCRGAGVQQIRLRTQCRQVPSRARALRDAGTDQAGCSDSRGEGPTDKAPPVDIALVCGAVREGVQPAAVSLPLRPLPLVAATVPPSLDLRRRPRCVSPINSALSVSGVPVSHIHCPVRGRHTSRGRECG